METAERSETTQKPAFRWQRRHLWLLAVAVLAVTVVIIGTRGGDEKFVPVDPPTEPVDAWFPYWVGTWAPETTPFAAHQSLFGSISPFWYAAGAPGSTDPTLIRASTQDGSGIPQQLIDEARAAGVAVIPSIVDDYDAGGMAAILADPTTRAAHVDAVADFAADNGFDGIDLDYEKFAFADDSSTWDATRPNWVAFVQELGARLHADGRLLAVTTPALWESDGKVNYRVYDWQSIVSSVDVLRVMTYDYNVSEAGPLAPLSWVGDTLAYATKAGVPPGKLRIGIPTYGKDWVTATDGTCPAGADLSARTLPMNTIDAFIANISASPARDESSGEMTFTYNETRTGAATDGSSTSCTVTHTVWYLDAVAVDARAQLAADHGAGVALWALGYETQATWDALGSVYAPPTTTAATASPTSG